VNNPFHAQESDRFGRSRARTLRRMSNLEPDSAALRAAFNGALHFLQRLNEIPVAPSAQSPALRKRLAKPLSDEGLPAKEVITNLIEDCEGGIVGSASGRFFGWAIGGTLPSAIAADWLVSTWDQNAALYSCGPAAAVVEEIVGSWLKNLLGLPNGATFALTTGCQMAHVTCIAAARRALLKKLGWDVERDGLSSAPAIRILANDQRHGSIERAARLLGFGTQAIIDLPTDPTGCVGADTLDEVLREQHPSSPVIVLLQAGDFHTGAFDNFGSLIPVAHRYGAWVHVDGAFGLWAAASPEHHHLTEAINKADSWAVDGHKWLNVPFDCGYAIVADGPSHREALSHRAAYLTHDLEARDQIDWNPEWSRRARGLPTYAALRQLGRKGVAELVNRCCQLASSLVLQIGTLPGVEILAPPVINQGMLRFLAPQSDASQEDHDRRTDEVIAAVTATGEAFFTGSRWRGRRVMRVSVCNWRTGERDVARAVNAFRKVLAGKVVAQR
jgi:glutamate/tyrosine decarboxylase-like PLP-dependent enzyme